MQTNKKSPPYPKIPGLDFEKSLWEKGYPFIAGVDEAGRGAWAGPVSAAAVILPQEETLEKALLGVKDSKLMSAKQRFVWADIIKHTALAWGIGFSSHEEIDTLGILPATRLAMKRALEQLDPGAQFLLVDAVRLPSINLPQEALIKGDRCCLSIAAASVLAKTARDAWMCAQTGTYPHFGFHNHKGYGTKQHQLALKEYGPTPIHRRSFKPVQLRLFTEK